MAAASLASHNPSIDENEKPIGGKFSSSSPPPGSSSNGPFTFRPPRPTMKDKARSYLMSTHFQCAVQLTVGVAFLSLFVLVEEMRFPMSCQAAVIYGTFFFLFSFFSNLSRRGRKNSPVFLHFFSFFF